MFTQTFKRNEVKFIVNKEQFYFLCKELLKRMEYDRFCKNGNPYTIYNVYFDTKNDDLIRKSLEKPYYKEKLRLRSYKMPTEKDDMVFLELKKKIGGVVAKRRAILHYNEAMELIANGKFPNTNSYQDTQVVQEIKKFSSRNEVYPKVYISYERIAFFDKLNSNFRVSFDYNIITRREKVDLKDGDYGNELMDVDTYVMEIKCDSSIPLWLTSILSQLKVYKTGFSKYGTEYKKHIKKEGRKVC
jgi:SPX domain protein involved in polyphosphate accumulation